jgi:hypothetical protein
MASIHKILKAEHEPMTKSNQMCGMFEQNSEPVNR